MNKEEIERLAKYIADYLVKEDVAVIHSKVYTFSTIYPLILEAVEQYDVKEQIRYKKKRMREMVFTVREKCGGSQMPFNMVDHVLNWLENAKSFAFELGFGNIEKEIKKAHKILLANQTMDGRIKADQVLCKIINQLDEELKNG